MPHSRRCTHSTCLPVFTCWHILRAGLRCTTASPKRECWLRRCQQGTPPSPCRLALQGSTFAHTASTYKPVSQPAAYQQHAPPPAASAAPYVPGHAAATGPPSQGAGFRAPSAVRPPPKSQLERAVYSGAVPATHMVAASLAEPRIVAVKAWEQQDCGMPNNKNLGAAAVTCRRPCATHPPRVGRETHEGE